MRLRYDEKVDALYLRLDESKVVESEEVQPGIVVDFNAKEQVVGIEVLTIDARVVVASVDAYLRFVAACNRLELTEGSRPLGLPEAVGQVDRRPARSEVRVSSA